MLDPVLAEGYITVVNSAGKIPSSQIMQSSKETNNKNTNYSKIVRENDRETI